MIFQYQQLAEPIIQAADPPPPPLPPLTWLPVFPDRVPHRRSILAPFAAASPFVFSSALPLRVSQLPAEVIFAYGSVLTRVSQMPVEAVWAYAVAIRQVRVSQIAVEIVYPFGCHIFVPPLPNPCPVPNPDEADGIACAAPWLDSDPDLLT